MKLRPMPLLLMLGTFGGLGWGSAQDLAAYRTAAQQLDAAAAGAGRDALTTLKQLDAAQAALNKLAPTLSNTGLANGLRDGMDAIRAAQARTPAELQAQVLLTRGLMRKGLYDQTMNLLSTAPASGFAELELLAQELGADGAAVKTDLKAGHLNRVAWRLQRAATGKLSAALNAVQPQQSTASYLNLTRAASWFTVVQDAGRTIQPPLSAGQFNQALAELTGGKSAELQGSLKTLRSGVSALNQALASPPTSASTGQPSVVTPDRNQPTPPTPVPNPTPGRVTPAPVATAGGVAATYASLARALTAAGHANLPAARTELTRAAGALAGAQNLRSVTGYNALLEHMRALALRQAVRPGDVQALMAELGTVEEQAAGRPTSLMDGLAGSSSRALGGGLRAILAFLIALACAAPLYLLNLAFGGRNPFWRAISAALLLLLTPALADGVFGLLGWLGDLLNVPFLRGLLNLTPGQSAFGVPLRMLTTALALGLATYGFRGLCIQFGLLGGKKPGVAKPAALKPKNPEQTSFDWDEEV